MLQSKSLAGDSSVLFSPPSIVKNSLLEESTSLHSIMSADNTPEPLKYEELDIEAVISAKTKVQHRSIPTNPLPNPNYNYVFKEIPGPAFENYQEYEIPKNNDFDNGNEFKSNYENNENQNFENHNFVNNDNVQNYDRQNFHVFKDITNLQSPRNERQFEVFKDITNVESPRSFARLNADRLRTITNANDLACENLIAPKDVLANALADHIYKVTNQKPSTSKIDEILTNKMAKENTNTQWWNVERDTGQDQMYTGEYYTYSNM